MVGLAAVKNNISLKFTQYKMRTLKKNPEEVSNIHLV